MRSVFALVVFSLGPQTARIKLKKSSLIIWVYLVTTPPWVKCTYRTADIYYLYTIKCDISIPKAWSMSEDYLKDLPLRF